MTGEEAHKKHVVLVLGPMERRYDRPLPVLYHALQRLATWLVGQPVGDYVRGEETRTSQIKDIVSSIIEELRQEGVTQAEDYAAFSPDKPDNPQLITSILDLIERAELVVIDLSGHRVNTAYEVGIVHSLGLPYLFITAGAQPPFYFNQNATILNFDNVDAYDPKNREHAALRRRIREFFLNGTAANTQAFARNALTEYYGLPIVDIAGPSGLAAGYYANSIKRFVGESGFIGEPVVISWPGKEKTDPPHVRDIALAHLITIPSPSRLLGSGAITDFKLADEALNGLGLARRGVTIKSKDGKRTFGGDLLVYKDTGEFVEPGIVVDVPTTLYALHYSPRVRRLNQLGAAVTLKRKERLLELMLESFARNIAYQFNSEPDAGQEKPFDLVELSGLRTVLTRLEVRLPPV